ncbi:MAG: ABC transporter permease [Firmicutes bacterium]|nr:ABC transporter permease [Bacillota bacterium]
MFIFKNALISITRNKGRNILIGAIILVIACASTITLAINNTASDLINSYQSAYDKELTISFDRKNMMKDMDFSNKDNRESMKEKISSISSYTISDVENFAKSSHIKSYYYTYNISLNGKSIEKAESDSNNEKGDRPNFPGKENEESSYDFTLNGYSSVDAMSEFIEGKYEMKEIADNAWDIAFDGNYVFINEELASYNNLKLHDKITLVDDNERTYEFEIIGIYKENEEESSGPMSMFSNSANTLITNSNSLVNITKENTNIKSSIKPTFIIDDYKNADKIEKEFHKKGLDENYTVETNEEQATAGLTSIKNVKSFANTFLIITLVIGGIVLFVINMINIRERKYEIGVLRTIGISKIKLTMQFVAELLIVGFVALMLGAGVGATMSKGVSNSLLSSEIKSSEKEQEELKNNFGGPSGNFDSKQGEPSMNFKNKGTPNVQAYDSINAVVSPIVLVELLGVGLTLIVVSSLSSMISIQRFTPLTILKERS